MAQFFNPYAMLGGGQGLPGFNDPSVDSTLTVKSAAGTPVTPAQPQGQPNQLSPDILGLISMLGQYGSTLSGGQNTIMGQVGGVASGQAQNALFNQFLQMLSGGGGKQATPFNQAQ